jgi:hypothetical protein
MLAGGLLQAKSAAVNIIISMKAKAAMNFLFRSKDVAALGCSSGFTKSNTN